MYITEFRYHNGYYDSRKKEFRGFAEAEKIEKGSDAQGAPALETFYQFNTGSQSEALKGRPLAVETRTDKGEIFYKESYVWMTRVLAKRKKYDSYGNIIAIHDALWGKEPGHYREIVYDNVFYT